VARAKRTERAEARRRYREATATAATEEGDDAAPEVPAAALPRSARERHPADGHPVEPSQRPGFLGALRTAANPADIPGDLRALPGIILRSKAGWLPALVIAATTAALLVPSLASNQVVAMAGNVILQPPPMIIAFLAGMLAPRGAWLMGGLLSLFAGLAYVLVVVVSANVQVTPLGWTFAVSMDQKVAYAQNVLVTTPVFGIAVGAFAGFYRRFLNMSSPARQQPARRR